MSYNRPRIRLEMSTLDMVHAMSEGNPGAVQNSTCQTRDHINTAGNNPNASVSIEAYVLRKFIKAPQ